MHPRLGSKLSKPSKVASILDWKKAFNNTVLAVNFHKNRVGIAVASHPSLGIPCRELEPLRFDGEGNNNNGTNKIRNKKNIAGAIDRECLERFSEIIETHKVCGVVVNWPLQSETGRMGAACGRVIFALEQLWERSNESIAASASSADDASLDANNNNRNLQERGGLLSRPFCLWDAGHIDLKQRADPSKRVDVFGRCASYGKEQPRSSSEWSQRTRAADGSSSSSSSSTSSTSASTAHTSRYGNDGSKACDYFASKEQYHEDELTVVLGVWDDFCREHWPDLYITAAAATSSNSPNLHSNNDEEGKNIKDDGTHDSSSLYSDLGGPSKAKPPPPKLREVTKKKKCLVTMR
mmetsp:Transcript_21540/g.48429  ORF Transcript_21540/g.48429 Transcript_21540/m.48429 type:complete len:351 (+) Transcript_21540:307-1359(+)|eukprot:CAMPEP_0201117840 /NCGR_PEP_ID=MMETSP0850-20130426/1870_1 /ASSEMBLY_ACC=CAM_ASM_000622 /TAXON_ID=183588 /ORGANISM="Pseudo-nitzschia fraudulenta, Strain WWA7" /LENGTH=350 /DNA_ID=CAMNT_0047382511 /DNA_START=315 /DNA_END=1367 /DNA_ORIENTATION=+